MHIVDDLRNPEGVAEEYQDGQVVLQDRMHASGNAKEKCTRYQANDHKRTEKL